MALCKIIEHFPNSDGWQAGDIVDITNPESLIMEGKVEIVKPSLAKSRIKTPAVEKVSGFRSRVKSFLKDNLQFVK